MNILKDRVTLVTGGGSGIGRASAVKFAEEGAIVVIAGRREDRGLETENIIRESGGNALYVKTDISRNDDVKNLINEIESKYGRLDCAFNCGGVDGKKSSIVDMTEEDWDEIIDINLKGTFLLLKHEIALMLKQNRGSIVNMASVCGIVARPGRCAYNSSRHAIIGLTKTADLEYSDKGIKVNAVAPGSIKTDIFYRSTQGNPALEKFYADSHPIKRIGMPGEVAECALWLLSDASSFVAGHTLFVDGGFTIQ